jgi:hypothetical protein
MSSGNRTGEVLSASKLQNSEINSGSDLAANAQVIEINRKLEELALFVAQAWQDHHAASLPNGVQPDSTADFQACVSYVTAEMAQAGAAVGGPAGLEILTGGGSTAACIACRSILTADND